MDHRSHSDILRPGMFCYTNHMQKEEYNSRMFLRDLVTFVRPYRGVFLFATISRFFSDIASLYPAYALASVVTFLSTWKPGQSAMPLGVIFLLWAVAVTIRTLGQYVARRYGYRAVETIQLDVQRMAIEHLYKLDIAWHEQENAGNKLKRITSGAEAVDKLGRMWFTNCIEIVVVLIGTVFILATVDLTVSIASVFFMVTYYVLSRRLIKPAMAAARAVNEKEEELVGIMFEGLNNIRTTKVLNMVISLMRRFNRGAKEVIKRVDYRISRFQFRNLVLVSWMHAFRLGALAFIAVGILNGRFEVGFLLIFFGYFSHIQESIMELSDTVETYVTSRYSISRLMEILNAPVATIEPKDARAFPTNWQTISLRNVSFSYGGQPVLRSVSFDIHRGERVGVVGMSGAGKSTLFKLLLKENEGYEGEILVDDVPLRDIKKDSFYKQATVVLQETEVFNFSLRENITIANPTEAKNPRALKKAMDVAHVTPFLSRLPDGVESLIGEKGVKLSGGERQRVGIARAVFKEPTILFLDEATSHLDLESEEKIRDSLHVVFQQVTAVVIAHRLTTIKEMDRIIVMENGRVLESGSFDELYKKHGRFYALWQKQKLD